MRGKATFLLRQATIAGLNAVTGFWIVQQVYWARQLVTPKTRS